MSQSCSHWIGIDTFGSCLYTHLETPQKSPSLVFLIDLYNLDFGKEFIHRMLEEICKVILFI